MDIKGTPNKTEKATINNQMLMFLRNIKAILTCNETDKKKNKQAKNQVCNPSKNNFIFFFEGEIMKWRQTVSWLTDVKVKFWRTVVVKDRT